MGDWETLQDQLNKFIQKQIEETEEFKATLNKGIEDAKQNEMKVLLTQIVSRLDLIEKRFRDEDEEVEDSIKGTARTIR